MMDIDLNPIIFHKVLCDTVLSRYLGKQIRYRYDTPYHPEAYVFYCDDCTAQLPTPPTVCHMYHFSDCPSGRSLVAGLFDYRMDIS
jgi:hypothetical protein